VGVVGVSIVGSSDGLYIAMNTFRFESSCMWYDISNRSINELLLCLSLLQCQRNKWVIVYSI
jgi:hypothetical protein